jgi:hypothetical protein
VIVAANIRIEGVVLTSSDIRKLVSSYMRKSLQETVEIQERGEIVLRKSFAEELPHSIPAM